MESIKQYRVKLLSFDEEWQILNNINQVNEYIKRDVVTRNSVQYFQQIHFKITGKLFVTPSDYIVESYDWDRLEFLPSHFGIIKNKMCK